LKQLLRSLCSPFFWLASYAWNFLGKNASVPSWQRETRPSKKFAARKRPSFWILAGLSLILISAIFSLSDEETQATSARAELLALGWKSIAAGSCQQKNTFYFVENQIESAELYVDENGDSLANGPLPEPPYECLAIPKPQFIQEI
jgi:hypothetical protein